MALPNGAEGRAARAIVDLAQSDLSLSTFVREVLAVLRDAVGMIHVCARWKNRPLMRFNLNRYDSRPFRRSQLETVLGLLPTVEASLAALFAQSSNKVELPGLTQREREVAELVARGLSSAEIGHILGTSRYTVRNQLSRIYEKLHLGSRAELAAYVSRMSNSSLS